jgi:hypothetical protein
MRRRGELRAETASARLAVLDETPDGAQLAALVSLAARVEPALLRDARLRAQLDSGAESDLWFSPVLSSAGRLGLVLEPSVADLLRGRLADEPADLTLARALLRDHHGEAPWSTRLEERINELSIAGDAEQIEELIAAALVRLRAVWDEDERAAIAIARWLLTWLNRMPAVAAGTSMAATAGVAAGAYLDGRLRTVDGLTEQARAEWLPWLLGRLGADPLPLRLTPGGLAIGGRGSSAPLLSVPRTDPAVVTVRWGETDGAEQLELRLRRDGIAQLVPSGGAAVEVRTLVGEGFVIRPAGVGRWVMPLGGETTAVAVADDLALAVPPPGTSFGPELGTFVPDRGEAIAVAGVAGSAVADVVTLRLAGTAPAVLPIATPRRGQPCWIGLAGAAGIPTEVVSDPDEPSIRLRVDTASELRGQAGAPVTVFEPWGALIGVVTALSTTTEPADATVLAAPAAAALAGALADVPPTPAPPSGTPPLHVRVALEPDTMADAIVIGSGVGGATIAYRLAEAGRRVLVLERGPFVTPTGGAGEEPMPDASASLQIRRPSVVGGATLATHGFVAAPPGHALERWSASFDVDRLYEAIDRAESQLSVLSREPTRWKELVPNVPFRSVARATAQSLSAMELLGRGQAHFGLDVVADCRVDRLEHANGRVVGVACEVGGRREHLQALEIVVAAGSFGTSALLQRSGIGGDVVGRVNTPLYATIVAEFAEPVDAADVPPVALAGPEGEHYELSLPPPHELVLSLPGALELRQEIMQRYPRLLSARVLVAGDTRGRLGRAERLELEPSDADLDGLVTGLQRVGTMLFEQGAIRLFPFVAGDVLECRDPADLDRLSRRRRDLTLTIEQPAGGAAIGEVVDEFLGVRGFGNLTVADAAALPSAVPYPHLTIRAIAEMAADRSVYRA